MIQKYCIILCLFILSFSIQAVDVFSSFDNSHQVIEVEKAKEKELQNVLDRVYGFDNIVLALNMIMTQLSVTEVKDEQSMFLLPGVPIKEIRHNVSSPKKINEYKLDHYKVTVWVDSNFANTNKAIELIQQSLKDPNVKKAPEIIINKVDFTSVVSHVSGNIQVMMEQDKIQDKMQAENARIMDNLKSDLNGQIKSQINTVIKLVDQKSGVITLRELIFMVIFGVVCVSLLGILGVLFMISRNASAMSAAATTDAASASSSGGFSGGASSAASSAMAGAGAAAAAGAGGGGGGGGGLDDEVTFKQSASLRDFFAFINEGNILKLVYLLENSKPLTLGSELDNFWWEVAIVISYLPPAFGNIILSRFSMAEQADIIPYLVYETEQTSVSIKNIENKYRERVAALTGGRKTIIPLIDMFTNEKKTELTKVLGTKYPDVLVEIREMIILFEDIINLPPEILTKVFIEMDPAGLAIALIHFEQTQLNAMIANLPSGLQAMINEVVELRKANVTEIEVTNAKDIVIKTAKVLEHLGVISIVRTDFGSAVAKLDQVDVDKFFKKENPA